MIYVVLGMHKSGTTLISQILHASGINMGEFDEKVSYDQGNQYERLEAQSINRILLHCGDAHSLDVINPVTEMGIEVHLANQIKKLAADLSSRWSNWGFKDPRTCLTYPIWEQLLPEHKIIYVYRDPLELWHHYRKYIPKRKFFQRAQEGCKALNAWYIYNKQLLKYFQELKHPSCIIEFNRFMSLAEEIERLSDFVGFQLKDCRDKRLYRSKPKTDIIFNICSAWLFRNKGRDINHLKKLLDNSYERHMGLNWITTQHD